MDYDAPAQVPVDGISMSLYLLERDGAVVSRGRPGGGAIGAKKWQADLDKWWMDHVGGAIYKPSRLFVEVKP